MIAYDIDPSLHDHEPSPPVLDDGFSPPPAPPRGPEGEPEGATPLDGVPRTAR